MNVSEVTRFISTTIGGVICIGLAVAGLVDPPWLAIDQSFAYVLLAAGLACFGVQVVTGYQATRTSAALKGGK